MFTGLVAERGRVLTASADPRTGGVKLEVQVSAELASELEIGASLAVSGCCLTVVERGEESVALELSAETLRRTTLGARREGDGINLEPALRLGDRLGGHWVQGHVDATVELVERVDGGEFSTFWWALPAELAPYLVEKGSVTLDGVSLTVADLEAERFSVALIPHTLEVTTLGDSAVGARFNLEVDVLAKYVERSLRAYRDHPSAPPAAR